MNELLIQYGQPLLQVFGQTIGVDGGRIYSYHPVFLAITKLTGSLRNLRAS